MDKINRLDHKLDFFIQIRYIFRTLSRFSRATKARSKTQKHYENQQIIHQAHQGNEKR